MAKPLEGPVYARHLDQLSTPARGAVLQKRLLGRACRYRFANPLMQPYVLMRGVSEGTLDADVLPH